MVGEPSCQFSSGNSGRCHPYGDSSAITRSTTRTHTHPFVRRTIRPHSEVHVSCRHTAGKHGSHLTEHDDRKQTAHALSSKVSCHLPDTDACTRTADKRVTQDSSWSFEIVARGCPVLLITHMILQDRNDVLATAHEPPSADEVERALVVRVYSISNPRAQICLVEPYRVAERGSSLHIECEPGLGAGGREVCAPEDIAGVISIVTGVEDN